MLQIEGNTRQERFLDAVKKLNIRFPVAEISRKTGYGKTTVADYLSKKEASEEFLRKFSGVYNIAFELIWEGPQRLEEPEPPKYSNGNDDLTQKLIKSLEDQLEWLKTENKRLAKELETSSKRLFLYAQINTARIKTILECQKVLRASVLKAKVDQKYLVVATEEVDKLYEGIRQEILDAGTPEAHGMI
jgi:transcriptional regulator with XRE-family HTH domain